jgi:methionyl-tRNA synthetase
MWSVQDSISKYEFRNGLKGVLDIASAGNQILQFNEPWKAIKEEPQAVAVVLNLCIQYVAAMSVAMHPFMPAASARLRKMLSLEPLEEQGVWVETMDALSNGELLVADEHVLHEAEHLFSRIEDDWVETQVKKLHEMAREDVPQAPIETTPPASVKPSVSYDDFAKLDIRTAKIIDAEKVPKADKLLKLTLEVNGTTRTVVSGIAEHYKPEDLPGKSVIILANLEPRKIRGVQSEGMILMAESGDGKLHFVHASFDASGMAIG